MASDMANGSHILCLGGVFRKNKFFYEITKSALNKLLQQQPWRIR